MEVDLLYSHIKVFLFCVPESSTEQNFDDNLFKLRLFRRFVYKNPLRIFTSFIQELIDVEGDGMADMAFRCIQEMDIDNRMMVSNFLEKYCHL